MSNTMQQRFHELAREKDKLLADLAPLEKQYDDLRREQQAITEKLKPIKAQLKEKRAPIAEIDNERAALSRALNGQTGKPE